MKYFIMIVIKNQANKIKRCQDGRVYIKKEQKVYNDVWHLEEKMFDHKGSDLIYFYYSYLIGQTFNIKPFGQIII